MKRGIKPVSYTHLDVYKRQGRTRSAGSGTGDAGTGSNGPYGAMHAGRAGNPFAGGVAHQ